MKHLDLEVETHRDLGVETRRYLGVETHWDLQLETRFNTWGLGDSYTQEFGNSTKLKHTGFEC